MVHEPQHQKNEDDLYWRFWTIQKKSDKDTYKAHEHNLISGDAVSFSGQDLPEGIVSGNKYTVLISSTSKTKLGKKSFDVCATLVPSNPFDHSPSNPFDYSRDLQAGVEPRIRILRPSFPVGLYRDAAHRYHTKGTNAELSKRWDGVNVRQLSTDCFEFAKLFCSKTKKDLKNYFAPDQESSPELLYNMIIYCKAFHSSKAQPLHGFFSFFCDGDEVLTNRLAPVLDGIQFEAAILTACRNTICHGDFYSLEEVVFERLKESSAKILHYIEDAALIMNHNEHTQAFQRVHEVASFQRQEIFLDDFTQHPPQICILNRLIELTSEQQQHLNEIIQGYQLEIRELQDQFLSMRRRPFSKLPVCTLQDIRKQIADQSCKSGAQGNVYFVELWGEQLAAKLVHSGKDAHLKRELNSLTVLLHGNIVQVKYVIYDGLDGKDQQDKQEPVGYVMERMHCSLVDYSKESHSMEQLLALLKQVALAVAYTHANNVARMDIKPENILLDESISVAKLCDFGCAHFLQTTLQTTLTSRGTKFFMAPEIIPDDVGSCKPFPVDVYAFGVTMWHLMNPGANCQQLSECDWSRSPQVPPAVSQLGRRCTNRNPDERPTMQEVYETLKNIVASPYALYRFLESAGIVPAEHCHEFARELSAQGVHDEVCLQRKLKQTSEFLNTIGMNSDQQMRLFLHLIQHFASRAAPVDVGTLSGTAPAAFLPLVPSGNYDTMPVSSPSAVLAANTHFLTDISVTDMALIVRAAIDVCSDAHLTRLTGGLPWNRL